jgi:hypothetical protein
VHREAREGEPLLSRTETPSVEVLYTCGRVPWDNGTPGFGGDYARIAGFGYQGEGHTVDQALERLADAMLEHVENWDANIDQQAHARCDLGRDPSLRIRR